METGQLYVRGEGVTASNQPGECRSRNGSKRCMCSSDGVRESTNWHVEIDGLTRPSPFCLPPRDHLSRTDSSDITAQPAPTRHPSRGRQGVMGVTIVTGGGGCHHRIHADGRPTDRLSVCQTSRLYSAEPMPLHGASSTRSVTAPTNKQSHSIPPARSPQRAS